MKSSNLTNFSYFVENSQKATLTFSSDQGFQWSLVTSQYILTDDCL